MDIDTQAVIMPSDLLAQLSKTHKIHDLDQLKSKILGAIAAQMKGLKDLSVEQKKDFGAKINQAKAEAEAAISQRKDYILKQELEHKLASESVDVSLDGRGNPLGALHPISLSLQRMLEIFQQLGFSVADGPEIETDYY